MGSIPLPALSVRPPEQQDPVGRYLQMKSLLNQQQLQQSQITSQQQEQQIRAQQIKDQGAITQAWRSWDGKDPSSLTKGVLDAGGSGNAANQVEQMLMARQQQKLQLGEGEFALEQKKNDRMLGRFDAAESVPDADLATHVKSAVDDSVQAGDLDPAHAQNMYQMLQQTSDPKQLRAGLDSAKKQYQLDSVQFSQAKEQAETNASNAKAGLDNADKFLKQNQADVITAYKNNPNLLLQQVDAIAPAAKYGDLNMRTKAGIHNAIMSGDIEGAKGLIKQASEEAGGIEKETNPAVQAAKLHLATAEKSAEQAIADGDPKAAAQLLISGTVAPSQIISSRKPAFAQQAFSAAAAMQPGWNAQKADADFKVASSPTNVAFFGSAKSLTDKGGTLDQLAAAAKDIPAGQIPVFNTVADALKASTGSGPIAKYASIALGVSDDYSKVMGGGQGSDTSRNDALQLVSAKQSPEQRAGSIEGIRGSVLSQINSRMGNNAVLKKMYGDIVPAQPQQQYVPGEPAQGLKEGATGKGSDGNNYVVKGGVWTAQP